MRTFQNSLTSHHRAHFVVHTQHQEQTGLREIGPQTVKYEFQELMVQNQCDQRQSHRLRANQFRQSSLHQIRMVSTRNPYSSFIC